MFRHVGIVVEDLEKMRGFYESLGLEVMYDEVEEGPFLEHILGLPKAKAHILKLGKNNQTIVELLAFDSYVNRLLNNRLHLKGLTHFALTIENLDELFEKLSKNNIKFLNNPKVSPDNKVKVAFCVDPEDNFIELVEILK